LIEWLWPWLSLLAPLPWLLRRLLPPAARRQPALRAPFFEDWRELEATQRGSMARGSLLPGALLWLAWLLLLAAAARPTWVGEPVELPRSGRDLMLAIDISGSMRIEDMQVGERLLPRIAVVRELGSSFIERRRGDRIGLILFGSKAYVQSPLSFDTRTVGRFLAEAQIGFAGTETAIGDAIGLAVKRLRERPAQSRVLILLTDGQDTASAVPPREAAQVAADLGIRIHTIGVGADALTLPGLFGSSFGARQINPAAELDEATLQKIAQLTGGRYFRARDPRELAGIYQLLDELEPVEQARAVYRPRRALGYIPLLLALCATFALALWAARDVLARKSGARDHTGSEAA